MSRRLWRKQRKDGRGRANVRIYESYGRGGVMETVIRNREVSHNGVSVVQSPRGA